MIGTKVPMLAAELSRMRRDPREYRVSERLWCHLGCGKGAAYALTHEKRTRAGTWCPVHGWLHFDSVGLPPEKEREKMKAA